MIELKEISKKYKDVVALDNVSLNIDNGQIIGLFGENGAGKTTLMKSVFGYISHDGSILLDGEKITRKKMQKLSYATCEHSFFPGITASDHKEFFRDQFDDFKEKRFDVLMEFFGLPMDKKIKTFSTGGQNQFEVILALSQGADYIFMDEPFAGNDIFNREDFYKVLVGIIEPNETVVIATHLIEEIENFIDRAILIRQGQIIGDITREQLEEREISVTDYMKEQFHYKANRILDAINEIGLGD